MLRFTKVLGFKSAPGTYSTYACLRAETRRFLSDSNVVNCDKIDLMILSGPLQGASKHQIRMPTISVNRQLVRTITTNSQQSEGKVLKEAIQKSSSKNNINKGLNDAAANAARLRHERLIKNQQQAKVLMVAMGFGAVIGCFAILVQYHYEYISPRPKMQEASTTPLSPIISSLQTQPPLPQVVEYPKIIRLLDTNFRLGVCSERCMLGLCSVERARAYTYGIYLSPVAATKVIEKDGLDGLCAFDKTMKIISNPTLNTNSNSQTDFIPSPMFVGSRPGYLFQNGPKGLGYYMDSSSNNKVANNESSTAATGVKDSEFEPVLIRLILNRDIHGNHLSNGFDRSLLWRVRKAQNGEKEGSGKQALRDLTQFFSNFYPENVDWKKGTIIDFLRTKNGKLLLYINGEETASFDSPILSYAILDCYLGEAYGYLSKQSRKELIDNATEIVNRKYIIG